MNAMRALGASRAKSVTCLLIAAGFLLAGASGADAATKKKRARGSFAYGTQEANSALGFDPFASATGIAAPSNPLPGIGGLAAPQAGNDAGVKSGGSLNLRPPIRIPYRPPLRSIWRPPLI